MKARALIVDDDPKIRQILWRWLEKWGYGLTEANSATEALEIMLADPAQIVLADIRMPGHDGLWLAERVRAKWPNTVVVIISGLSDLHSVEDARRKGAIDFVTKPVGREQLWQALERAHARLSIPA